MRYVINIRDCPRGVTYIHKFKYQFPEIPNWGCIKEHRDFINMESSTIRFCEDVLPQ